MRTVYFYLLFLTFLFLPDRGRAQLIIQPQQTAVQMAQALTGAAVTITNPTLTCPDSASGTFTSGAVSTNLGMADGVLLTNGRAKSSGSFSGADGPQFLFASNAYNAPGDADLNALSGGVSYDACVLECDVKAAYDTLLFEYVFGSEEYQVYSCSPFNDAFGFFISGPGIAGAQNLALIPGTSIPVAINSTTDTSVTHPFNPVPCLAMGAGAPFAQYYNDNSIGSEVTYFGLTTVMQVIRKVDTGVVYHLKFVVADLGDAALDAGVFIKGNSITSRSGSNGPTRLAEVKNTRPGVVPNPFTGAPVLNLPPAWNSEEVEATLCDATGRSLFRRSATGNTLTGSISQAIQPYPAGLYFLRLSAPRIGATHVLKLEKQ